MPRWVMVAQAAAMGGGRPRAAVVADPYSPPGQPSKRKYCSGSMPLVAVEQEGRTLEAPPVLVDVRRQRGHAVDAEVPRRQRLAQPFEERQQPAAETGVDVAQRPARPPATPARGSGRRPRTGSRGPSRPPAPCARRPPPPWSPRRPGRRARRGHGPPRRRGSGTPWRAQGGRSTAPRSPARRCRAPCGRGRGRPAPQGTGSRCRRSSASRPGGCRAAGRRPWPRPRAPCAAGWGRRTGSGSSRAGTPAPPPPASARARGRPGCRRG